jgi:hypothetical protein
MKHILLGLMLIVLFVNKDYGQQQYAITPGISDDYCPGVPVVFNVSIVGNSPSITSKALNVAPSIVNGVYDVQSSNGITTFKFAGQFIDENNKQTFALGFRYGSTNRDTSIDLTFTNIKSLKHATTCDAIQSIAAVSAPSCQTVSFGINFNTVKYGNSFVSPTTCYGTVTAYEYQLPSGWKIGNNTSTGSNWIAAQVKFK